MRFGTEVKLVTIDAECVEICEVEISVDFAGNPGSQMPGLLAIDPEAGATEQLLTTAVSSLNSANFLLALCLKPSKSGRLSIASSIKSSEYICKSSFFCF